ncbi:MAG: kelch repeat-containing protein [Bacteroidota bacterium]
MYRIVLVLILFATACNSSQYILESNAVGKWAEIKAVDGSAPVQRHEAAFIAVGDQFYLLGGRGIKPTSIYNTKTQSWSEGAIVPIEMHHFQPVVYDDKIYIMGALTGGYPGETPIPNIYIYDPTVDTWQKGPTIPADRQRGGAGVSVYKGKIYLSCGIKDGHRGDHKKWLDVFDPITQQWSTLPDAPRARDHFQSVVADDKLYLLGGRTTISADNPMKHTIAQIDVFDFKTQTWSTLPNGLPTLRAGNYVTLYGQDILVMGGESFAQVPAHAEVEVLNIKSKEWRTLSPMLQGRHGTGVINYQGKLWVASGSGNRGGGPELTSMECLSFD